MQEEVTQKSIALVIRTSKLTADVLKKAMIAYLNHLKNKQANWHGKISVKKLMGKVIDALALLSVVTVPVSSYSAVP